MARHVHVVIGRDGAFGVVTLRHQCRWEDSGCLMLCIRASARFSGVGSWHCVHVWLSRPGRGPMTKGREERGN